MTATQHSLPESSKELHTKPFYINSRIQNKAHLAAILVVILNFLNPQ